MGRATVATSRGLSALTGNVGALGLDRMGERDSAQRIELDVSILPFGAAAGSTYLDADDLNFVFDSKNREDFDDADRERLAGLVEEGRLSADAALDLVALRVRFPGSMALGFRYGHRVQAQMTFPENFRNNVLASGGIYDQPDIYRNPEIGGGWTRHATLALSGSWNRPYVLPEGERQVWFPSAGFGFSLSYLDGIAHFEIDSKSYARTRIISRAGETPRRVEVEGAYTFRSASTLDSSFSPADAILTPSFIGGNQSAGNGWEGAVGVSVVVLRTRGGTVATDGANPLIPMPSSRREGVERDAVTFGLQIEGVGSMKWEGRNYRRVNADIHDTISESDGPISNDIIYRYEVPLDTIGAFTTERGTTLRMGVGCDITAFAPEIPGDLVAGLEAAFDLNDVVGEGEGSTRLSLGAEWHLPGGFYVRSGLQLGGRVGAAMALGGGFHPFEILQIDIASGEVLSLLTGDGRRLDLALRGVLHWEF